MLKALTLTWEAYIFNVVLDNLQRGLNFNSQNPNLLIKVPHKVRKKNGPALKS